MRKKIYSTWIHVFQMPLIAITLFFSLWTGSAQALDFKDISQVYFFGDSLTDGGFNDLWGTSVPPLPPGKAPTFTSYGGYTWAQYVAHDIKFYPLPVYTAPTVPDLITNNSIFKINNPKPDFVSGNLIGVNYAASGAKTNAPGYGQSWAPSLHQQITYFIQNLGGQLDPNALYFIWCGANDFLGLIASSPTFPTELEFLMTAQIAAKNIANDIAEMSRHGAKKIVVLSLPNIGLSPFANIFGIPDKMKNLSFMFNSMLNVELGNLIQQFGVKILYVDLYTLLEKVIDTIKAKQNFVVDGKSFKFTNYTEIACPGFSAIYCIPGAPSDYIFADLVHPTDLAHQVIAAEVERSIKEWR